VKYLSLFSGIGGMDLGLDRAGMTCVGQCEIDPFCRRVLAKHWPSVWRWDDVRTLTGDIVREHCGPVDIIAAGFPCQPVSVNGLGKAQDDERWLWPETARVVDELRPGGLLLENVTGLLGRGLGDVLRDLASIGYDAEWDSVPAAAFGAPHLRERVFVVSHPASAGSQGQEPAGRIWGRGVLAQRDRWEPEPAVCRVANGVPNRVDRLRGLGNAVVPQVAEFIGRLIMEAA
jgi:DNA (cytosine-5)-methyltransferase 1